jgi:hypothetical protein
LFLPKGYVGLPESGWAGLHLEYAKEVAGQSGVVLVLRKENLMGTDVRVVSYEGAETGGWGGRLRCGRGTFLSFSSLFDIFEEDGGDGNRDEWLKRKERLE